MAKPSLCLFPPPLAVAVPGSEQGQQQAGGQQGPGSSVPADTAETLLWRVWDLLMNMMEADREMYLELRAGLLAGLAALRVDAATRLRALKPFLGRASSGAAGVQRLKDQLFLLWVELQPRQAASLMIRRPAVIKAFFAGSKARITLWFSHFSMDGLQAFKYGARALARYALTNRHEAWQHLVWEGKHPQAPVTVATKTHYFCELDVVATVRALLKHCPGFWESDVFKECIEGREEEEEGGGGGGGAAHAGDDAQQQAAHREGRGSGGGDIIQLDPTFFAKALADLCDDGDQLGGQVEAALHHWLSTVPWSALCHRLSHMLDDEQLIQFVECIGGALRVPTALEASPGTPAALTASLDMACLPLAYGPKWRGVTQLVLTHALACQRRQLLQLCIAQSQANDEQQRVWTQLCDLVVRLYPPAPEQHTATQQALSELVHSLRDPRTSASSRQLLALHCWTLHTCLVMHIMLPVTHVDVPSHETSQDRTWLSAICQHLGIAITAHPDAGGAGALAGASGKGGQAKSTQQHHYALLASSGSSDDSSNDSESDSDSDSSAGSDRKRRKRKGKHRKKRKSKRRKVKGGRSGRRQVRGSRDVEQGSSDDSGGRVRRKARRNRRARSDDDSGSEQGNERVVSAGSLGATLSASAQHCLSQQTQSSLSSTSFDCLLPGSMWEELSGRSSLRTAPQAVHMCVLELIDLVACLSTRRCLVSVLRG